MLSEEERKKMKIVERIVLLTLYIPLMLISFYYFPCVPITILITFFGIYILTKFYDKEE